MRFISLLFFVMLISVSAVKAQQRDTIHGKSGTGRIKLKKELNLTREQSRSLKSINQEYKSKADSIRNDNTLTKEQKKQLIIERRQKIMELLTPEQRAKYKTLSSPPAKEGKASKTPGVVVLL